ncbi:thiamine phosphate synthase [Pseudorhizobium halotolerans]|uniref:Thiamine-phosphate synthase n=1 Tax=Pseudorhizobium halotolerans TaxID=1233081 RepID=A0ABN7JF11_9HYPH|nr:thiamine phosphate synthase [Pseudorhizobium halotolerans]CAD7023930.1 thiamine phosphate synthase [Pseudorhizobium halotolerans]
MKIFDLSLYVVLDPDLCRSVGMVETARLAAEGGATMMQLRDKRADRTSLIETGKALKAALAGYGIPLIVNDDVEAALEIGADGVHVGQEDMSAAAARLAIGDQLIIGLSVETAQLAHEVDPSIVDYVGVGPVFATGTKPDHKQPIGLDGLAHIVSVSPVPAVAIGGLKMEHAASVIAAGAAGLAVVSAVCGTPDPRSAARALIQETEGARP